MVSMCSLHCVHLVRACTMVEIHTRLFKCIYRLLNQIFEYEKKLAVQREPAIFHDENNNNLY